MTPTVEYFGTTESNKDVHLIKLKNDAGTEISLISYGTTMVKWLVLDKDRVTTDVLLGYDTVNEYEKDTFYIGCTVGRVANRIKRGLFELDGNIYKLAVNNPPNHLHGGCQNALNRKIWSFELIEGKNAVKFHGNSCDGEEGYPGNLQVDVKFTLDESSELTIDYTAKTDRTTIISLTNHSYFNLEGEDSQSIASHLFQFFTDKYLPIDDHQMVTGEIADAKNTRWDFSQPKHLDALDETKNRFNYDNHMCYDPTKFSDGPIRPIAKVYAAKRGLSLEVSSSYIGAQFYTGDSLDVIAGKNGRQYREGCGFAIETQAFPDAVNNPNFPSNILRSDDTYHSVTRYKITSSE